MIIDKRINIKKYLLSILLLSVLSSYLLNIELVKGSCAETISQSQEQYARNLPSADAFIISAIWKDASSLWVMIDPDNCHCADWKYLAKKFARTIAKEAVDTLHQSEGKRKICKEELWQVLIIERTFLLLTRKNHYQKQ